MTFFGKFRGGDAMEGHLHESPGIMTWPLVVLAAGSIVAGYLGLPHWFLGAGNWIEHYLEPAILAGTPAEVVEAHHAPATEVLFTLIAVSVAALGLYLAYRFYMKKPETPERLAERWSRAHQVLYNKYYVDELYGATVVMGTLNTCNGLNWADAKVVDGLVNGFAGGTRLSAFFSDLFDMNLVDGAVNLIGALFGFFSKGFRHIQTGLVQNYAMLMLVGIFIIVTFFMIWS
jgi:NADH-quinone oxidoreductase subunit L